MILFFQEPAAAQQTANFIPVWVAVIGLVGTIFASGTFAGVITFFLTRNKFKAEVAGQNIKNAGDNIKNIGENLKNYGFGNDLFNAISTQVMNYRAENVRLADENHTLTQKLKMKEYEIAEEIGKRKQAIDDRDKVFERIDELEASLEYENKNCQQNIVHLGLKYEAELRWMRNRIETLADILRSNNIEVPAGEYNETEALKDLVNHDGHKNGF